MTTRRMKAVMMRRTEMTFAAVDMLFHQDATRPMKDVEDCGDCAR